MRRRVDPSWPVLTVEVGFLPLFLVILLLSQVPAGSGSDKSSEARDLKESKRQNVTGEFHVLLLGVYPWLFQPMFCHDSYISITAS